MGNMTKNIRNSKPANGRKTPRKLYAVLGAVILLITGIVLIKGLLDGGGSTVSVNGDLFIKKSDVTETVRFYPYKAGSVRMEVLAVKAGDGTIRTAFNTCQVCFNSGKGYYKQQGDTLVCQNCGNVFKTDQVEKIKGGCNPVPVLEENKTDDGTNITISKDFLIENKELFGNWKK